MSVPATLPVNEIVPRRVRIEIPPDAPRHWLARDPASTHLMNALSVGFPRGEKLFVDSVRAYRDRIRDPQLAETVRRFVAQETHHSREHTAFNDWLAGLGLPVAELSRMVDHDIDLSEKHLSAEVLLATTAALEHFTALIAQAMVDSPSFVEDIDESVRVLWLWHALEEMEHKAVAIDVYRHVGGREWIRIATMAFITAHFVRDALGNQAMFMDADGHGRDLRSYASFARRFFGRGGYLSGMLLPYLAYYRRDFHPWKDDDGSTLRKARTMLEEAMRRAARTREAA